MNQRRTMAAVSLLVLLGGLLLFASPQATTKAPAKPTTKKQAAKKPKMTGTPKGHAVIIHPGAAGPSGPTCTALNQTLKKSNQDFATWKVAGNPADTYKVKFDKPEGSPCDNGLIELVIPGSGGESTACTVQRVDLGGAKQKSFNYSIYIVVGGNDQKCADPSVDVQP